MRWWCRASERESNLVDATVESTEQRHLLAVHVVCMCDDGRLGRAGGRQNEGNWQGTNQGGLTVIRRRVRDMAGAVLA